MDQAQALAIVRSLANGRAACRADEGLLRRRPWRRWRIDAEALERGLARISASAAASAEARGFVRVGGITRAPALGELVELPLVESGDELSGAAILTDVVAVVGELLRESAGIAAPIVGSDGKVVAALAIGAPSDRFEVARPTLQEMLVDVARRASGIMPGSGLLRN
jgi:DNA-binding IclR family transcriptional regulator